jgi:hypothetical protein
MYADLRVPVSKSTTVQDRRKLVAQLWDYGYTCIAITTTVYNHLDKEHRCDLQPVTFAANAKSAAGQRSSTQIGSTAQINMRQLTRINVVCDTLADARCMALGRSVQQQIVSNFCSGCKAFHASS